MTQQQTFLTPPAPGSTPETKSGEPPKEETAATPPPAAPEADKGEQTPAASPPPAEPDATTTEEQPKEGDKKDEAKASPEVAELDIKLPEGVAADQVLLDAFKAEAKAAGLKGEVAQKIANVYVEAQKRQEQQYQEHWAKTQEKWLSSVREDKEIGGANFEKNQRIARQFLSKFFEPAINDVLISSGLGNHPELIRGCIRAGHALLEDNAGAVTGANATPEMSADERIARAVMPSLFSKDT